MVAQQDRTFVVLLAIIVVILGGAALSVTQLVTMPFAFAFFLAVLVWPIHCAVQRRAPPGLRWTAVAAAMLTIVLALVVFGAGVWFVAHQLAQDRELIAQYRAQLAEQLRLAEDWLRARGLPVPGEDDDGIFAAQLFDWFQLALGSALGLLVALVLIFFFALLMLIEAEHWRKKSETAMGDGRAAVVIDAVEAITRQVRAFLLVQAFVAFVTALVTAVWLWFMGVPFVPLWTLLTFLVDFVPNLGPTIAGILVSLVALVTLGWGPAIVTALGLLAIQQFFGNYINPVLIGRRLTISPLVVLLSVVFWAWVWGPGGAVIAVPITATLIIACAHVPALRPIALMLSRTADVGEMMKQTQGSNPRR
jgi:AI-2 transport protein TqsA